MFGDQLSIHQTIAYPINHGEGEGWEFVCERCEYRARYFICESGERQLHILNVGDPHARHMSQQVQSEQVEEIEVPIDGHDAEDEVEFFDEENWLTPELRAQIEVIVQKFDLDSY